MSKRSLANLQTDLDHAMDKFYARRCFQAEKCDVCGVRFLPLFSSPEFLQDHFAQMGPENKGKVDEMHHL